MRPRQNAARNGGRERGASFAMKVLRQCSLVLLVKAGKRKCTAFRSGEGKVTINGTKEISR
jgi:hypothetical protein